MLNFNKNLEDEAIEIRSWKNSMEYMYKVLSDDEIPNDSGVAMSLIFLQHLKELILFYQVMIKI